MMDIYEDLDEFHEQEQKKSRELLELETKYNDSLKQIEALNLEKKELRKLNNIMKDNFQSLLNTANAEIKRKDKIIEQLRKEMDDICFRRQKIHISKASSTKCNSASLFSNADSAQISISQQVENICGTSSERKEKIESTSDVPIDNVDKDSDFTKYTIPKISKYITEKGEQNKMVHNSQKESQKRLSCNEGHTSERRSRRSRERCFDKLQRKYSRDRSSDYLTNRIDREYYEYEEDNFTSKRRSRRSRDRCFEKTQKKYRRDRSSDYLTNRIDREYIEYEEDNFTSERRSRRSRQLKYKEDNFSRERSSNSKNSEEHDSKCYERESYHRSGRLEDSRCEPSSHNRKYDSKRELSKRNIRPRDDDFENIGTKRQKIDLKFSTDLQTKKQRQRSPLHSSKKSRSSYDQERDERDNYRRKSKSDDSNSDLKSSKNLERRSRSRDKKRKKSCDSLHSFKDESRNRRHSLYNQYKSKERKNEDEKEQSSENWVGKELVNIWSEEEGEYSSKITNNKKTQVKYADETIKMKDINGDQSLKNPSQVSITESMVAERSCSTIPETNKNTKNKENGENPKYDQNYSSVGTQKTFTLFNALFGATPSKVEQTNAACDRFLNADEILETCGGNSVTTFSDAFTDLSEFSTIESSKALNELVNSDLENSYSEPTNTLNISQQNTLKSSISSFLSVSDNNLSQYKQDITSNAVSATMFTNKQLTSLNKLNLIESSNKDLEMTTVTENIQEINVPYVLSTSMASKLPKTNIINNVTTLNEQIQTKSTTDLSDEVVKDKHADKEITNFDKKDATIISKEKFVLNDTLKIPKRTVGQMHSGKICDISSLNSLEKLKEPLTLNNLSINQLKPSFFCETKTVDFKELPKNDYFTASDKVNEEKNVSSLESKKVTLNNQIVENDDFTALDDADSAATAEIKKLKNIQEESMNEKKILSELKTDKICEMIISNKVESNGNFNFNELSNCASETILNPTGNETSDKTNKTALNDNHIFSKLESAEFGHATVSVQLKSPVHTCTVSKNTQLPKCEKLEMTASCDSMTSNKKVSNEIGKKTLLNIVNPVVKVDTIASTASSPTYNNKFVNEFKKTKLVNGTTSKEIKSEGNINTSASKKVIKCFEVSKNLASEITNKKTLQRVVNKLKPINVKGKSEIKKTFQKSEKYDNENSKIKSTDNINGLSHKESKPMVEGRFSSKEINKQKLEILNNVTNMSNSNEISCLDLTLSSSDNDSVSDSIPLSQLQKKEKIEIIENIRLPALFKTDKLEEESENNSKNKKQKCSIKTFSKSTKAISSPKIDVIKPYSSLKSKDIDNNAENCDSGIVDEVTSQKEMLVAQNNSPDEIENYITVEDETLNDVFDEASKIVFNSTSENIFASNKLSTSVIDQNDSSTTAFSKKVKNNSKLPKKQKNPIQQKSKSKIEKIKDKIPKPSVQKETLSLTQSEATPFKNANVETPKLNTSDDIKAMLTQDSSSPVCSNETILKSQAQNGERLDDIEKNMQAIFQSPSKNKDANLLSAANASQHDLSTNKTDSSSHNNSFETKRFSLGSSLYVIENDPITNVATIFITRKKRQKRIENKILKLK